MGQSQGAQDESAMEVLPDLGRLALTCWDYAWPLRREYGPGGGAVERALDEAVERGFNAVRLDPYPHLLATPANSVHLDRCEIFAEPDARRGIGAGGTTRSSAGCTCWSSPGSRSTRTRPSRTWSFSWR